VDLTKRYFDGDGYPINILDAVRACAEWAANRIQVGERAIAMLSPEQQRAAESGGAVANGEQLAQPAKCLDCEYWQKPRGGFCLRGDRDTYCVKVGTQQASAQ